MNVLARVVLSTCLFSPAAVALAAELADDFRQPPPAARPWVYYWWLSGNVSEASITRDLEAMHSKGIGGLLMFDARGYHDNYVPPPPPAMEFMSPRWRALVKHTVEEAARLGLKVSINLSSCAGALKGPWPVGEDAPKKLLWATTDVEGPQRLAVPLPRVESSRSWDVAVLAVRRQGQAAAEVVDLADKVAEGQIAWDVPAGKWTILRFACGTMEGHEYDVDVLSPPAVEGHFRRMGDAVLDDAGPLAGKTITHLYSVSWEGAIPTWTFGLEKHFRQYRGYEMKRYLPVLAGVTVEDAEVSERFLRDYHKTLGDLFMDHFYGTLRRLSHRRGVAWHSESGGPWDRKLATFRQADQLAFLGRNDMPQGEFWVRGTQSLNRPIAMAAHIYGRPLAATEAFTHMLHHWSVYPALLKPRADEAYCDGINFFIWHTFTASPPEFGKPGIDYFAGTHFNPNVTWWEQSRPLVDYLARCQAMMQRGRPVVDVCCYVGDRPYQHWGRAEKWSNAAAYTLGPGYGYDLLSTEVLLERLKVKDRKLVLPEGLSYRLLVVDLEDESIEPAALAKIAALAEGGATVVLGRRPTRAVGLAGWPDSDQTVRQTAGKLWDATSGKAVGKGKVFTSGSLDAILAAEGVLPDAETVYDYEHRVDGDTDVYLVAGRAASCGECVFRVADREPEIWDPVTGRMRDAVFYRPTDDGRTVVPLTLWENESALVVFRRPAEKGRIEAIRPPEAAQADIAGRSDGGARLVLWGDGRYQVQTPAGTRTIEVAGSPAAVALDSDWEVRFAGLGAPASVRFPRLVPWNEHGDAAIRHYAGTAVYSKRFELDAAQAAAAARLDLGEVKNLARVRLNGRDLGVVWTAPWRVDLTGALRAGENVLEIDVTNVWANRLIGDAALPPEKRLTKTNVPLTAEKRTKALRPHMGYSASDPLLPSGLTGPVGVVFGRAAEVAW